MKKLLFLYLLFLCDCSVKYYEKSADRDIKELWKKNYKKVENQKLPGSVLKESVLSETQILTLSSAIKTGLKNNREYKTKKEDVYFKILDYTYQRYLFKKRYSLGGNIEWEKTDEESISGDLNFSLIKLLANGAQITFDITKEFLKYFTGDKKKDFQTFLSLNFFQPILKGAGKEIILENLTQAERDIIYEIRDFLRYERSLTVQISKKYLDILMLKKNTEIYWKNYQFLKKIRERNENLAMAGRLSPIYVDMAKQDEFSAYQRWVSSVNDYKNAVDEFKVFLGLPPEKKIEIDDRFIKEILTKGIEKFDIDLKDGIATALRKRLDLLTYYDEVYDAERKVKVAINNLKGVVNFNFSVETSTESKSKPNFDFQKPEYNGGIEIELPVDKLYERNEYKKKLIELERARRNFEEKKDEITLEVIENYRNLEEAYQSYLIQKKQFVSCRKKSGKY